MKDVTPPELKKTFTKISKVFDRLKKDYPRELLVDFNNNDEIFAKYGWYIYDGTGIEEVLIILKLINQGEIKKAEEKIENIYEHNLEDLEDDLTVINAESSHIVKEAMICHRKQLYYASTILFLSLADGQVQGKLFTKQYFQKIKKQNKNHFLLDIFNDYNRVNKPFIPNKSPDSELMRHGIMHGSSKNYGSKTNSLKALGLFHYISIRV